MKELSFEKMEEVNGGEWTQEDTVAVICGVGPYALFWFPIGSFALRSACVVTSAMILLYHATN